jgi:glycosyltransferase involved in cell wall biosynthesis
MENLKTVFINGRFLTQPYTGINKYAFELCLAMQKCGQEFQLIAPRNTKLSNKYGFKIIYYGRLKSHLWEQINLYFFLRKKNDLLISFSGIGPLLYRKQIITIHDLSFMRNKKWFSWKYTLIYSILTPILAKKAKKIITVSEFSKHEIVDLLKIKPEKVSVVPSAVAFNADKISEGSKLNGLEYFLAVSSIDPRKNFERLINGFKKAKLTNIKLCIVGGRFKNFNSKGLQLNSSEKIEYLGYVSNSELINLYKNALGFIYPSLYEGFGLPPLEAMNFGCPTIVSNIPALNESCGNASYKVDPYNEEDLAKAIEILAVDKNLRDSLIVNGYNNVERFSFESSAQKIIDIINSF